MKKIILILIVTAFMGGISLTARSYPSDKRVKTARQDSPKSQSNYSAEWQKFKNNAQRKITENENKIAELKVKAANKKAEAKEKYNKKIAELEQKNNDLKAKLEAYKDEGKDNWERFKKDFNHSMHEVGRSIKDLFDKD